MRRELRWHRRALKDLQQLAQQNPTMAQRIRDAMALYAEHERGDVRKLVGESDIYRLRVGDWRVLFGLEDGDLTILTLRVLNRRDAYR